MKKKLLFSLLVAIAPIVSFAQGCITIFSEDGDRFFLVLNGVKQNAAAQTNVRVDMLPNEYYSAKILFEDKSKPEISKNIPVKDPATNDWADVTYKIKRTKDGELKLRYFSATPVPVAYTPPADMYFVHYGQAPSAPVANVNSVTHTTHTTTTSNPTGASLNVNGGGLNMSVNVGDGVNGGGLNMNVNVNDGTTSSYSQNSSVTTTTTHTTTTSGGGYNDAPPAPARTGCGYPMDMASFTDAKRTIGNASFEDTKLSTAKSILSSNCVTTDQVMAICKMFSFEASKLDFAKFAYSKTTDRGNYFKVANVFSFDASKTELNEFIAQ
jgi:hypothetical protein